MPIISIIIPVYNTENYIEEAVMSVLNQTFKDLELIIVDDASTDNTYSICENIAKKDSRVKLFKNEKNLGMMSNWNHALNFITGKYWAKLDADDWWEENFIQDCYDIISKNHEVGMVCGRYVNIDENGNIVPKTEYKLSEHFKNKSIDFIWRVKKGVNGMFVPSLAQQGNGLIRADIIEKLGKYTLLPAGDTEFFFRIGAHYKIHFLDKLYHYHRIWSENFTRTHVLSSGRGEKNLYDVRKSIAEYYFENNLITKKQFTNLVTDNEFEYNKFLTAKYRKEGRFFLFFKLLVTNFIHKPIKTIKFYKSRLK